MIILAVWLYALPFIEGYSAARVCTMGLIGSEMALVDRLWLSFWLTGITCTFTDLII